MKITFDFTEDARRSSILSQLQQFLGEEEWERVNAEVARAAADAGFDAPDAHFHSIADVREAVNRLQIAPSTRAHMRAVYEILAAAEAQVHGCAVEETHFHEVGRGSALAGTLLICHAFSAFDAREVCATSVQVGCGIVHCAHGELDIPAPATRAILEGGIPVFATRLPGERCTPTSAAIIKHFVTRFI